jgi:hypothetical protein
MCVIVVWPDSITYINYYNDQPDKIPIVVHVVSINRDPLANSARSSRCLGVGCEQGIPTSHKSKFCNFAEDDDYISPLQLHQSLDKPFPRGSVTVQHISVLESHIDSKSKKTVKSHKRARTIFRLPPHSPSINPIQQHGQMPGDTPPDKKVTKILEKAGKAPKSPEQVQSNPQHPHRSTGSTHGQMAERLWR